MSDSPPTRLGCGRHLLILAALVGVAVLLFVLQSPDGVGRLLDNQRAMREGSEEARALETPEALLHWVRAHPERASLVVLDTDGLALLDVEGERSRPVAGLAVLWLVAEWAAKSARGGADATRIAPERLAVRRLPGTGTASDSAALSVSDLLRQAIGGDRAAESVLIEHLDAASVAARARRYGAEPPVPFEGLLLAWQAGDPTAEEAPALARRLATDEAFRAEAVRSFREDGFGLTLPEQRRAAAASLPRGTAHGYAHLLADALADSLGSPAASARFLDVLAAPDSVLGGGTRLGSKGGGLPGHLAVAAWVRTPDHPEGRAAVLVLDGLPIAVFYHLVQTGLDSALVLRLLTDDVFLAAANERGNRPEPPSRPRP